MHGFEVVHAAPEPGLNFSPCCDRTRAELPVIDRISRNPEQVTCGRLSATDQLLLAGRPVPAPTQNSEQLLFDMAVSVRTLCGPSITLQQAYDKVNAAAGELMAGRGQRERWSAALMVRIATRAAELARG